MRNEFQVDRALARLIDEALTSNTILWDVNLQIIDVISTNPSLLRYFLTCVEHACNSSNTTEIELGLTLLEMSVKNLGYIVLAKFNQQFVTTLVDLIKKPKSIMGKITRTKAVITNNTTMEEEKGRDIVISQKVLALFQTWADTFLMQQGQLTNFFNAYKKLRAKGYQFPTTDASTVRYQIRGAEASPALNPNLASSKHSEPANASPLDDEELTALHTTVAEAKSNLASITPQTLKQLKEDRLRLATLIQFKTDLMNVLQEKEDADTEAVSICVFQLLDLHSDLDQVIGQADVILENQLSAPSPSNTPVRRPPPNLLEFDENDPSIPLPEEEELDPAAQEFADHVLALYLQKIFDDEANRYQTQQTDLPYLADHTSSSAIPANLLSTNNNSLLIDAMDVNTATRVAKEQHLIRQFHKPKSKTERIQELAPTTDEVKQAMVDGANATANVANAIANVVASGSTAAVTTARTQFRRGSQVSRESTENEVLVGAGGEGHENLRRRGPEERAPLLIKIDPDEDWKVIRRDGVNPFWYNRQTQQSQWRPPDHIADWAKTD